MGNRDLVLDMRDVVKAFVKHRPLREVLRHPWERPLMSVLQGASLAVHRGESVALVGPNGVGKTTLAKIALGTLLPDAGTSLVLGVSAQKPAARSHLALALAKDTALHPRLNLLQALTFHLALYGKVLTDETWRALPEADALRLEELLCRRVATLSAGERARASLAKALLSSPDLLILDEIFPVLDPKMARHFEHILESRKKSGLAILLITHDMNLAQKCDRVALLTRGKITADGPWEKVFKQVQLAFEDEELRHLQEEAR